MAFHFGFGANLTANHSSASIGTRSRLIELWVRWDKWVSEYSCGFAVSHHVLVTVGHVAQLHALPFSAPVQYHLFHNVPPVFSMMGRF
jgi:hypothetical protein